ncbi:MAG: tRNA (adenosine(37)-N6)-dimethylallyltransferase MiaA [Algoriphagus sp.]|nr:tRNA (adenosine(37)-N6)-dimethylallyltransferase MiaA [Algoriphagus sp.]
MPTSPKYLILVVGPTAVGKSDLCLNLAKKFQTEILSCDSRQFYREMNRGTAKPTAEELAEIPHHFINNLSIYDAYDVRKYEMEAMDLLGQLFQKQGVVILTGGSGLFADVVVNGMDAIPQVDPGIREEVIHDYQIKGLSWLQGAVEEVDPEFYAQVDRDNPQRLMRALEIWRGTALKFSSFRTRKKIKRPFEVIKIGLDRPREELYQRIDSRMDQMLAEGLVQEAEGLFEKRGLSALQTLGYTEIFDFLEGKYGKEELIRLLKRNSRRYAKRQLTWFRRDPLIRWFHPSEEGEIFDFLANQIGLNPPKVATQL